MPESFLIQSNLGVVLGIAIGLIGGWLFHRIWRRFMPRTRSRAFWEALPGDLRRMLASDVPDDLIRCYLSLIAALARFAGRNTLAVGAGLVPVTLGFLFVEGLGVAEQFTTAFEQPLSPWLSGLEFWFFLSVVVGSAVSAWAARRARVVGA